MKKLAWFALVATGALSITACSGAENSAGPSNAAGGEAGALAGGEGAGGNEVTPVDGEGGSANGYDATAPIDTANGLDAAGNATDLTGNASSTGNAF